MALLRVPRSRYRHESVVAGSRMWVWGGKNQSGCHLQRTALSAYDPVAKEWAHHEFRAVPSASHVTPPKSEGSSCTVVGKTIYSCGGYNEDVGYLKELYQFDTSTHMVSQVSVRGKKPAPRTQSGLCFTEGRLVMFGGLGDATDKKQLQEGAQWIQVKDRTERVNNEFYELNVATGEWNYVEDSPQHRPQPRYGHTLTAVGHKVILFGGRGADCRLLSDVHVYDMRTGKWSGPIEPLRKPEPRAYHTACSLDCGRGDVLLILGGMGQDGDPCTDAAFLFDVESLMWYEITNHGLPLARIWHTTCCQQSGDAHTIHAIVFGGSLKPARDLQAVARLTTLVLGPTNPAYMECEERRLRDHMANLNIRLERPRTTGICGEAQTVNAQLTERVRELEQVVKETEQRRATEEARRIEATALVERHSNEIDRLQRRVRTAEAALQETEEQLNEYLNVLVIEADELRLQGGQLGSGSYGGVRAGYWRGVAVAVKTFHDSIMSPQLEPLCRRELFICSQLHHPHIVQVCGAVMVNGNPLQLVMELMQGSVNDLVEAAHKSSHYLSRREQIDVAIGTTAGIVYMHQLRPKPYVHCDIRPTNVMVTRDMVAKVGDLGASHVIQSSLSMGPVSIEYVAPERMPKADGTSTRSTCQSDIYSLGVSLIELFIGVTPIPAHRNKQILSIENGSMQDLCTLMTSVDPSQRPSAQECFDMIQRQKETSAYKERPGRRVVKGHLDGQTMSLVDQLYADL